MSEEHKASAHHGAGHSGGKRILGFEQKTVVLMAVLVIATAIVCTLAGFSAGAAGNQSVAVDKAMLASRVQDFVNKNLITDSTVSVKITDVNDQGGGLYALPYQVYQNGSVVESGQLYANKDNLIIGQVVSLSSTIPVQQQQAAAQPVKSDKPKVELFVMSYCPYGTQMEKAILPVISALGNKIDFKLEYTHFTLHGPKEDEENYRQLCIRDEQGDKFLPYIQCILDSNNPNAPGDQNACMAKLGIDANKVSSCMATNASTYYAADSALSQGYGVQGSPTLVINGAQADSSRSPAAVLSTICSAFNIAPSECSASLPSEQTAPGFGFNAASSSEYAAAQCGV